MPTMPTLPSRKLTKFWPSSGTKATASPEIGVISTEEDKDASDDQIIKESSQQAQQRLRQLFQEKEKDGLAADISLRRKTNERLYLAVEAYWSSLSKVKNLPFDMSAASALEVAMTLDEAKNACKTTYTNSSPLVLQAAEEGSKSVTNTKEKMLPVEALGLAMASCANTYLRSQKEDSVDKMQLKNNEVYASHLSHLSAVHLALAQLQAKYTSSLSSTLLSRLARSQAAIEALRITEKQTEATKEKMEIAEKKRDRAKEKGDKNRRDVEEEARMARATYEEAVADLESRTEILRDSEQRGPGSSVSILKEYMDIHLAWIEEQHEIMSKARAALDQYPSHQSSPQTSYSTFNNAVPNSTKGRAAPPPPPALTQASSRRIVEPPPPFIREEQRKRSISSSNVKHKPKLSSRGSFQDVLLKNSVTSKEGENSPRPQSREGSTFTDSIPSRGIKSRIPFARSESYSNINTSNDVSEKESLGKGETKKGRMSAIGASLGRSSSSLGMSTFDTAKTTPTTTGGTGTSTDPSSSEKGSSWASGILSRKNNPKKDSTYQVMTSDAPDAGNRSRRNLSHVQEGSAESRTATDNFIGLLPQDSTLANDSVSHHDDVLVGINREDGYGSQTPSPLKAWERFGDRHGSLGISSHLTGNTVSSEGSNPFGPEGSELSPVGTGNGPFMQQQYAKESWGQGLEDDDDDPADGLLGVRDATVRRPARK